MTSDRIAHARGHIQSDLEGHFDKLTALRAQSGSGLGFPQWLLTRNRMLEKTFNQILLSCLLRDFVSLVFLSGPGKGGGANEGYVSPLDMKRKATKKAGVQNACSRNVGEIVKR